MGIKFYGKSQEVTEKVIEMFETGDVPQALSQIFVKRSDNIPSASWSWRNQFLTAISGTSDARGFKQWKEAGRKVSKGSRCFHILGPCIAKKDMTDDETGETIKKSFLYGFKSIPVFALESTEVTDAEQWEKAGGVDQGEEDRLKGLPLVDVALAWGLKVTSYNGKGSGTLGMYSHGKGIALGTENLSTWTHELIHAADDKNGTIVKSSGQNAGNEIVAELGGAVLLKIMGKDSEADLGGAWDYVKAYAKDDKGKAVKRCFDLIDRICKAVDLIIKTATDNEIQQAA